MPVGHAVIPTNRSIVRDDRHDLVFKTRREKYNAVADEVEKNFKASKCSILTFSTPASSTSRH